MYAWPGASWLPLTAVWSIGFVSFVGGAAVDGQAQPAEPARVVRGRERDGEIGCPVRVVRRDERERARVAAERLELLQRVDRVAADEAGRGLVRRVGDRVVRARPGDEDAAGEVGRT